MDQGSAVGPPQGTPKRDVRLKVQLHFLLSHVGDLQAGTTGSTQLPVLSYGLPRLTARLSFWGLAAGGRGLGGGGLGVEKIEGEEEEGRKLMRRRGWW